MRSRPAILYLAHRVPYPPNKGDKIRTFNQVRFLSRYFDIDLVALVDTPGDAARMGAHEMHLKAFCRSVRLFAFNTAAAKLRGLAGMAAGTSISQGYFFVRAAAREVSRLLDGQVYQAVFCFSSPMAAYVFHCLGTPGKILPGLVMDFCDVDSEKWRQYANARAFPMNLLCRMEACRLRAFERKVHRCFDTSVLVSPGEADLFRSRVADTGDIRVVPNGVDHQYFSPVPTPAGETGSPLVLMFPGAMDYYANVEAVTWFCENVLPLLAADERPIRFDIVGRNPAPAVRSLENKRVGANIRVRVTGEVSDIRPYYAAAHMVVIPLRIARGIQNKVLEAMAMARPVIATPAAAEGIGAETGAHLETADSPSGFAAKISHWTDHPESATGTGRAARRFVAARFSWDACLETLIPILTPER